MPTLLKPCWLITKSLDPGGYPTARRNGKVVRLTRYELEKKLGRPIKPGYQCCHHCDTPNCIEPEHLYEGSRRQNTKDSIRRGRWGMG